MGAPRWPRGPDDLDEEERSRIRYQVLAGLRARRPTLADRLYGAVAVVGLPAPHLVRAAAVLVALVGLLAGATVASAGSLPDETLYPVKLATEQVRLALAQSGEDRAAVELSIAEHRLSEAEQLALRGRQPEAIVAGSLYGAELASAAADLAAVERRDPSAAPVLAQLKERLAQQRSQAAALAARLAADPATARLVPVFRSVASVPPSRSPGVLVSEAVAEHAAAVAGQVAGIAQELARRTEERQGDPLRAGASRSASAAARSAAPEPTRAGTATPTAAVRAGSAASATDAAPEESAARASDAVPEGSGGLPSAGAHEQRGAGPAPRDASVKAPGVDPAAAREAARRAEREAEKARREAERAKDAAKKAAPAEKEADHAHRAQPAHPDDRGKHKGSEGDRAHEDQREGD